MADSGTLTLRQRLMASRRNTDGDAHTSSRSSSHDSGATTSTKSDAAGGDQERCTSASPSPSEPAGAHNLPGGLPAAYFTDPKASSDLVEQDAVENEGPGAGANAALGAGDGEGLPPDSPWSGMDMTNNIMHPAGAAYAFEMFQFPASAATAQHFVDGDVLSEEYAGDEGLDDDSPRKPALKVQYPPLALVPAEAAPGEAVVPEAAPWYGRSGSNLGKIGRLSAESASSGAAMPEGAVLLPTGEVLWANGVKVHPDGTLEAPEGTGLGPGGVVRFADGSTGSAEVNGSVRLSDGGALLPNGWLKRPDGRLVLPNGDVLLLDGTIEREPQDSDAGLLSAGDALLELRHEPCACCAGTGAEPVMGLRWPRVGTLPFYCAAVLALVVGLAWEWAWELTYSVSRGAHDVMVSVMYPCLTVLLAPALHYFFSVYLLGMRPCSSSVSAAFLDTACGMGLIGVAVSNTVRRVVAVSGSGTVGIVVWAATGAVALALAVTTSVKLTSLTAHTEPFMLMNMAGGAWAYVCAQATYGVLHHIIASDPADPTVAGYLWLVCLMLPLLYSVTLGFALAASRAFGRSLKADLKWVRQVATWALIYLGLCCGYGLKAAVCPFMERHNAALPPGGAFAICVFEHPDQGPGGPAPTAPYFLGLIVTVLLAAGLSAALLLSLALLKARCARGMPDGGAHDPPAVFVGYVMLAASWQCAYGTAVYVHWLITDTLMIFVALAHPPGWRCGVLFVWALGLFVAGALLSHRADGAHARRLAAQRAWQERWAEAWPALWAKHSGFPEASDLRDQLRDDLERVMIGVDFLGPEAPQPHVQPSEGKCSVCHGRPTPPHDPLPPTAPSSHTTSPDALPGAGPDDGTRWEAAPLDQQAPMIVVTDADTGLPPVGVEFMNTSLSTDGVSYRGFPVNAAITDDTRASSDQESPGDDGGSGSSHPSHEPWHSLRMYGGHSKEPGKRYSGDVEGVVS